MEYLARFRQGAGPMAQNAIDYYRSGDEIIKHSWAMGGESKTVVDSAPDEIPGYENIGVILEANNA